MTATTLSYLAGREHIDDLLREAERNRRAAELVRPRRFRLRIPHLFAGDRVACAVEGRDASAALVDGRSVAAATRDNDAGVIWFVGECLRNGVRPESCARLAENAGDRELAEFFQRARRVSQLMMTEPRL